MLLKKSSEQQDKIVPLAPFWNIGNSDRCKNFGRAGKENTKYRQILRFLHKK